jgi:hypothetical protein
MNEAEDNLTSWEALFQGSWHSIYYDVGEPYYIIVNNKKLEVCIFHT